MKMNKRGATLESVVLIFLAFLLLVAGGYFIYVSLYKPTAIGIAKIEQTTIDTVTSVCDNACKTGLAVNLYCNEKQSIPYTDDSGKKQNLQASCYELAQKKLNSGKAINLPANIVFPGCASYNCKIPCQLKTDTEIGTTCSANDVKTGDDASAVEKKIKDCNTLVGCAYDDSSSTCKTASSECAAVVKDKVATDCKDVCKPTTA